MLQRLVQWMWLHLRAIVLTLTIGVSILFIIRSNEMNFGTVRWGMLHAVSTGQSILRVPIHLTALGQENRYLRSRLLEKVIRESELHELRAENIRLRRLLDFERDDRLDLLAAKVLAYDATVPPATIVIDVGTSDGVKQYYPVLSPEGLVGRVDQNPAGSRSLVRLLTDPGLRTSVTVDNGFRPMGIMRWDGYTMRIDNLPQEYPVSRDERVLTSGLGGIFPAGLFVGYVDSVRDDPHALFKDVTLIPTAHLDRLEEVFVVRVAPDSIGIATPEEFHAVDR
jgi:rod shape-determining protein MreC